MVLCNCCWSEHSRKSCLRTAEEVTVSHSACEIINKLRIHIPTVRDIFIQTRSCYILTVLAFAVAVVDQCC